MIDLTPMDAWWIECWTRLAEHLRRPPAVRELAGYADRSLSVTHVALTRLELAGAFERDDRRRYVRKGWRDRARGGDLR